MMLAIFLLAFGSLASDPTVTVEEIDGRQWWSVHAQDAALEKVLDRVARKSGRRLEGFDSLEQGAIVTVELNRRPLTQVLEYVVGTVGLSYELDTDALRIATPRPQNANELLASASAAWLRATTRFPSHPLAPGARLAQGELAELRGEPGVARDHYETLVENYPSAREAPEATMRSGLLLQDMGLWSEASLKFRTLSNLAPGAEYHAIARLELARCSIELGDPQSALHVLASLDANYPTTEPVEVTGRQLVRAQALNALDRSMEALRAIDQLDVSLDPLGQREAMRVRARALEGIGMPGEAARAWLLYSGEASGPDRVLALRESARLALQADDELGVLFVCREAERFGLVDELGPYWHEARVRLGLEEGAAEDGNMNTRLASAEALLENGEAAKAAVILEPMFRARGALEESMALRLLLAWSDSIDQRFDVEQAVRLLAKERESFQGAGARSAVDACAARLFERHGLFERAIAAYEGRY